MLRVAVVVLPLLKLATSISIDVDIDIHQAAAAADDADESAPILPKCVPLGDQCETDSDCCPILNWAYKAECSSSKKCKKVPWNHQHSTENPKPIQTSTEKPSCKHIGRDCQTDDECCYGECGNVTGGRKCTLNIFPPHWGKNKTTTSPPVVPPVNNCKSLYGKCETDDDCCQEDSKDIRKRVIKCSVNKRCFYNFFPGGADTSDETCVPEGRPCQADKKCCHCVESEDHVCFCKDGKCCDHNECVKVWPGGPEWSQWSP